MASTAECGVRVECRGGGILVGVAMRYTDTQCVVVNANAHPREESSWGHGGRNVALSDDIWINVAYFQRGSLS